MTTSHPRSAAPLVPVARRAPARCGGIMARAANAAFADVAGELPVLLDFSAPTLGAASPFHQAYQNRS